LKSKIATTYAIPILAIILIWVPLVCFHLFIPFWGYLLYGFIATTVFGYYGKIYYKIINENNSLKMNLQLLKESEEMYSKLIDCLPVPAIIHSSGLIYYVNKATLNVLGADDKEQVSSFLIYQLIHSDHHKEMKKQFLQCSNDIKNGVYKFLRIDRQIFYAEAASMEIQIETQKMILTIFQDITYRKKEEELIREMAYFCSLTKLPNRRYLEEKLFQAISEFVHFSLMFIDLDGFKKVNDTLGHDAGDEVLKIVAGRLSNSIREEDIVSRISGDEFIIFLTQADQESAIRIAERIITSFTSPMLVKGEAVNLTASIGISSYPKDGETPGELIKKADKAMYFAKHNGKNKYQLYYHEFETVK
jgi:diguanylate cyclase (GGDEF)-like protein/PAS domain S-box-containing protein